MGGIWWCTPMFVGLIPIILKICNECWLLIHYFYVLSFLVDYCYHPNKQGQDVIHDMDALLMSDMKIESALRPHFYLWLAEGNLPSEEERESQQGRDYGDCERCNGTYMQRATILLTIQRKDFYATCQNTSMPRAMILHAMWNDTSVQRAILLLCNVQY